MSMDDISIIATILGLAATICAFCFLIPEKKRAKLKNPFWIFLHDLFNFKTLWIETIFRFFYVFATITTIVCGFFMLFWVEKTGYDYWSGEASYEWLGYIGLIVMILGPIIIRIMYEFIMMAILLVKNVMSINKKLDQSRVATTNNQNQQIKNVMSINKKPDQSSIATTNNQNQQMHGATVNYCTHCGNILNDGDAFCTKCGKR